MSLSVKITILCENTIGARVGSGEHGFAAFVETPEANYLFDTGSGRFIVNNALEFGKDLRSITKIFLSHGHHDHAGGLPQILKLRGDVDVHAHPDIFVDRIALPTEEGGRKRYVGIPHKRIYLEMLGARFKFNRSFERVGEGMFLSGEIPRRTPFEKPDPRLQRKEGGTFTLDLFPDDQSLIFETPKGLVILLGCAHSGMINTIHHALENTQKMEIQGLIGGTHLDFLGPEQLERSIEALKEFRVSLVGVSHCTGLRPAARLSQAFGNRFRYGHVGAVFEIWAQRGAVPLLDIKPYLKKLDSKPDANDGWIERKQL